MKKILIAAAVVGAAASLVILYLRKRYPGEQFVDDARDLVQDSTDTVGKYAKKATREVNGIYSNAMG